MAEDLDKLRRELNKKKRCLSPAELHLLERLAVERSVNLIHLDSHDHDVVMLMRAVEDAELAMVRTR